MVEPQHNMIRSALRSAFNSRSGTRIILNRRTASRRIRSTYISAHQAMMLTMTINETSDESYDKSGIEGRLTTDSLSS